MAATSHPFDYLPACSPHPLTKHMTSVFRQYGDYKIAHGTIQMPTRVLPTTINQYPIDVLARHLEKYLTDPSSALDRYLWAARFVMGNPVPSRQRSLVWNAG